MPTKKNIPALLAQKFMHDYTEAIKNYALDQKIELLEHLHNGLRAFKSYFESKDLVAWEAYMKDEKRLQKKYGSHFKDYIGKRMNKYFNQETSILDSWLFEAEEFNSLTAQEQVLNDDQCHSFIWHCNNALSNDTKYLYLERPPEIEGLGKVHSEKAGRSSKINVEELGNNNSIKAKKSAKSDPDEEYMNIQELADFLDCSKVTVHTYKKNGLPYLKVGRKILFKKSEVLDFMRTTKNKRARL